MVRFGLIGVALLLTVAGCHRVKTSTTIASDGSFDRKSKYTLSSAAMSMGAFDTNGDPEKPQVEPSLRNMFKIPADSPKVKVVEGKEGEDNILTVSKVAIPASELKDDLVILDAKKSPVLSSSVRVEKRADGNLEYTETLHWVGKKKDDVEATLASLQSKLKSILPAEFQGDSTLKPLAKGLLVNMAQTVFGPPEPMLGQMLVDPEAAGYKMANALLVKNEALITKSLSSLPAEDRSKIALEISNALLETQDSFMPKEPDGSSNSKNDSNDLVAMMYEVAFPGTVVESNGIYDRVNGVVYWSLLAPSAQIQDVVLHVVIKP